MKKILPTDPEATGHDPIQANLACLRQCFPQAFTEGKVDFEVLKQLLGGAVDESPEKYGLSWNGKRKARMEALKTGTGTLRPAPQDSVAWDSTRNILIEGDNLEVLKLLRNSYANQVKLIYIDPPYNTGKDFVYRDDYQDNLKNYKEKQGDLGKEANTETSGRYHTDWLNLMYSRLVTCYDVLAPEGVLFVSIDDHEVSNLTTLCDEIFGVDNRLGILVWQHSLQPKGYSGKFSVHHNFVLCYQRSGEFQLSDMERTDEHNKNYSNPDNDPRGPWRSGDVRNALYRKNLIYPLPTPSGKTIAPPSKGWRWSKETMNEKIRTGEVVFADDETRIIRKIYLDNLEGRTPETILFGKDVGTTREAAAEIKGLFDGAVPFDTPKPTRLIRHLIDLSDIGEDDIVLDFFAGSGTTGHAVMAQNAADGGQRRYILVQLPEVLDPAKKEQKVAADFCDQLGKPRTIAELTKERLRRAAQKIKAEHPEYTGDLGFRVFKLDSSNLKAWDPDTQNVQQSLLDAVEHIKPGRSTDDVLYELLLKLGLDLAVPMQQRIIAGKVVHAIGGGVLLVCLEDGITTAVAEPLAMGMADWHAELKPEGRDTTVVFADSAFDGDVAKSNITAILEQRGLKNVRSV